MLKSWNGRKYVNKVHCFFKVNQCIELYLLSGGTCQCEKYYTGSRCQFKNNCDEDADCGEGQCIKVVAILNLKTNGLYVDTKNILNKYHTLNLVAF